MWFPDDTPKNKFYFYFKSLHKIIKIYNHLQFISYLVSFSKAFYFSYLLSRFILFEIPNPPCMFKLRRISTIFCFIIYEDYFLRISLMFGSKEPSTM